MGLLFSLRAFKLSDFFKGKWVSLCAVLFFVFVLGVGMDQFSSRWPSERTSKPLDFRQVADSASDLQLEDALMLLNQTPSTTLLRTRLKENPFWVSIDWHAQSTQHSILAIKSRHVHEAYCRVKNQSGQWTDVWNTQNPDATQPRYDSGAWSLPLPAALAAPLLLCRFKFVGPAHLQFELNHSEPTDAYRLARDTHRQGFLEGSLSLMIAIVTAMALNSKSRLFLCYGFWLIASLKMAALSEGWDHELFGHSLALSSLPLLRKWVLFAYFSSTVILAYAVFDNMKQGFWKPIVRILFLFIALLGLLALFAPYKLFLQIYWPLSLITLITLMAVVVDHFFQKHNATAVYYLIAMLITLLGGMSELFAAWFDSDVFMTYLNSSNVTLAASLMTAVSLTEHLRQIQLQRSRTAQKLKQAHEELKAIFDIAPSALFTASAAGRVLVQNSRFRSLFSGQNGPALHDCLSPEVLTTQFKNLLFKGQTSRLEFKHLAQDQSPRWLELVLARNSDTLVGMISDFTALKDKQLELEYQANHDELTGALNRRGLVVHLNRCFAASQHDFYVFAVDVSKFSKLSVAYGGEVTDQLLRALHALLCKYMSSCGSTARFGADQFCVVVAPEHLEYASIAFGRLVDKVHAAPLRLRDRQLQIKVFAIRMEIRGVSDTTSFMDSVEESLRQSKLRSNHLDLPAKLELSALQVNDYLKKLHEIQHIKAKKLPPNLTLAWQPILDLSSLSAPLYAEALLRLRNSDGSLSSAFELLNAAQQSGYSSVLDEWVIDRALTDLSIYADDLRHLHTLSVNVSPYSINDENFLQRAIELLKRHRRVAHKLCLEVTEVGMLINLSQIQRFFTEANSLGVRVALDDFGAGYSNFNYAMDLRVDVIKIDGSIIKNILTHPESLAVVKAIVALAHDLGCKCVAEWVESFEVLRELHDISVDYIQGYFVSEAVLPEMFRGVDSTVHLMKSVANIVRLKSLGL